MYDMLALASLVFGVFGALHHFRRSDRNSYIHAFVASRVGIAPVKRVGGMNSAQDPGISGEYRGAAGPQTSGRNS